MAEILLPNIGKNFNYLTRTKVGQTGGIRSPKEGVDVAWKFSRVGLYLVPSFLSFSVVRMAGHSRYEQLDGDDAVEEQSLPTEPPGYHEGHSGAVEQMDIEDPEAQGEPAGLDKLMQFRTSFTLHIVTPMREKVIDPLAHIFNLCSEKIDFYLNKVGNPLILRRIFYIIFMSVIAYSVLASGLMPSPQSLGMKGMFSDHDVLLQYAKQSLDLSKMERDLEYLSSMPHMSGTKGDSAMRAYIKQSFGNNGLHLISENEYLVYTNYFGNASLSATKNGQEQVTIELNSRNFNPMSATGHVKAGSLLYGYKGRDEDLQKLKENDLLNDNFVLLLEYDRFPPEQLLRAQKFGAKGVLFISESFNDDMDTVQMRPVAFSQFWTGDALTPGWYGSKIKDIRPQDSEVLPKIPSLPISAKQVSVLINMLSNRGALFANEKYSGTSKDVLVDLTVEPAVRERHPVYDVLGKIEGVEQSDKSLVIAASRTSPYSNSMFPNYSTVILLSLVQLFEEIRYKFNWKPLRNIYFISTGGSEFNYAGATELVELHTKSVKEDVFSFIDISKIGIDSNYKNINIQTHPLLEEFFKSNKMKYGFDVTTSNVQEYGDWIPFLANGVPVSVFSNAKTSVQTGSIIPDLEMNENFINLLGSSDGKNKAVSTLLYFYQIILKLADNPLLPFDISNFVRDVEDSIHKLQKAYPQKLNYERVLKSLSIWKSIGQEWSSWMKSWENIVMAHNNGLEPSLLSVHRWAWNKRLSKIGISQCYAAGLDKRRFYKNVLFDPPLHNPQNSDSWIFPGVFDAIASGDWNKAQKQLDIIDDLLSASTAIFREQTNNMNY